MSCRLCRYYYYVTVLLTDQSTLDIENLLRLVGSTPQYLRQEYTSTIIDPHSLSLFASGEIFSTSRYLHPAFSLNNVGLPEPDHKMYLAITLRKTAPRTLKEFSYVLGKAVIAAVTVLLLVDAIVSLVLPFI